ncbi:MAG: polysaccharide deacetylase family protein [Terriglobales bacterium]
MTNSRLRGLFSPLAIFLALCGISAAQKAAITFDDLPRNGDLPPGVTQAETAKVAVAILKKKHVPPAHGFLNAIRLEGSPDGAEALKIWAASEPVGNHTYSHMDLEKSTPEAWERDLAQDEPTLELLSPKGDWRWLRYPYLHEGDTVEKRRAVRDYLKTHGYRIAEVTIDWEDYLWNFAYARCAPKNDQKAIEWLHSSYLSTASEFIDLARAQSQLLFGREIHYVLLLHLGAYTSTILPEAIDLLSKKGFQFETLEEAEKDPAYESDPDAGIKDGGTLLDQLMLVKKIPLPPHAEKPYGQVEHICE